MQLYRRRNVKKGEITIFLALLLGTVCALICVIIESARAQAIRLRIETLMDIGLHSCFGEYHQDLFKRYDLLYIDTTYGGTENVPENVIQHLIEYVEENLSETGNEAVAGEWFRLFVEQVQAEQFLLASDDTGRVLQNQAVNYMKSYGDISHCSLTEQHINYIVHKETRNFMGEWSAIQRKVDGYGKSFTNPAEIIKSYSGTDILELISIEDTTLSFIPYDNIPSMRIMREGTYHGNYYCTETGKDKVRIFDEYLVQKCAKYSDKKTESVLNCELEYIIYGEQNDRSNLKCAADELLYIREKENLDCLLSDSGKCEEARELAEELVGFYMIEDLTEAVKESIIYAWAFAESTIEISTLLSGGKINLQKNAGEWILSLENLLEFREQMKQKRWDGLLYEEYLGILLDNVEEDIKNQRFMDIIEMNMRQFSNSSFRIDSCLEFLEAEIYFKSGFGYAYHIKRNYGYEEYSNTKTKVVNDNALFHTQK